MSAIHTSLLQKRNNKFSSKFVVDYGIHLGGHVKLLALETSSVIFGIRTSNIIINLSFTTLELLKVLKSLEGLGFERAVIYFINSILSFRLSFKSSYKKFNRHLFFPTSLVIDNVLRKIKFLLAIDLTDKKKKDKVFRRVKTIKNFLFKSGKFLLRKIFISTKWSYGFVSNGASFFSFTENVLHEKVKFAKNIELFSRKVKELVDFYPFLPHYGFIGDHRLNYWVVNEFSQVNIPTASVIDTFSTKSLLSMYGIPGNSCSTDSTLFFLILLISNYLFGYYQQVNKFCYLEVTQKPKEFTDNFFKNKKFFFKKFFIFEKITAKF